MTLLKTSSNYVYSAQNRWVELKYIEEYQSSEEKNLKTIICVFLCAIYNKITCMHLKLYKSKVMASFLHIDLQITAIGKRRLKEIILGLLAYKLYRFS